MDTVLQVVVTVFLILFGLFLLGCYRTDRQARKARERLYWKLEMPAPPPERTAREGDLVGHYDRFVIPLLEQDLVLLYDGNPDLEVRVFRLSRRFDMSSASYTGETVTIIAPSEHGGL